MAKKIVALALGAALLVVAVVFAFMGVGNPVSASIDAGETVTTLQDLSAALCVSTPEAYAADLAEDSNVCVQYYSQTKRTYQYEDGQSGAVSNSRTMTVYFIEGAVYAKASGKLVQKNEQTTTSSSSMNKYEAELLLQEGKTYVRFGVYDYTGAVTDPDLEEGETSPAIELQKSYAKAIKAVNGKWIDLSGVVTDETQRAAAEYLAYLSGLIFNWSSVPALGEIIAANEEAFDRNEGVYSYSTEGMELTVLLSQAANPVVYYTTSAESETTTIEEYGSITVLGWQGVQLKASAENAVSVDSVFASLAQAEGGNQ